MCIVVNPTGTTSTTTTSNPSGSAAVPVDNKIASASSTSKTSSTINSTMSSLKSSNSSAGIMSSWMNYVHQRQVLIDKLNERVVTITQKAIEKQQSSPDQPPLAPEFVYAQQKMTVLTAGAPIYQLRCAPLVYLYTMIALCLVIYGASQLHPLVTLVCITTMFLGYDVYSGVLHVVFDHPNNIALPILGQPCLEFQWHHSIPDDIVRKDFVDVCGDLNVVIGLLIGLNVYLLPLNSGMALLLGGTKLLMAYFGQYSHKSAHCVGKSLNTVAKWLQTQGFMVSTKAHMSHHQPPYNVDYCLVGPGNALIDTMRRITHNNTLWLSIFIVWSMFDIYILTHVMHMIFGTPTVVV